MTRLARDSRGFTLAELLIACAILGFMMAALVGLQRQGQLAYLTGSARVEVQQNARLALDSMINDIRSALPVGGTTQVITAIDGNCITGPPPTVPGGGTSISFTAQDGHAVTYRLTGSNLERVDNGTATVVVGGVQTLQIWCYNNASPPALNATLATIREIRIQITTQTERSAQANSAGDQHARVEGRVRFRNI
jgi:prepilin-type N-terminal cleavage/methylation domain-containing protein